MGLSSFRIVVSNVDLVEEGVVAGTTSVEAGNVNQLVVVAGVPSHATLRSQERLGALTATLTRTRTLFHHC